MMNKAIPPNEGGGRERGGEVTLRGAGEAFGDIKQMGLSGATPLGKVKTKAPNSDYNKGQGR